MRQVNAKRLSVSIDFSIEGLIDAIGILYNPSFERPLENTRFTVILPNAFSGHAMLKSEEIKHYNIEWTICKEGILEYDSWIVICQDSGAMLTCEGA